MSPSRLPPKQTEELYHLGISSQRDVYLRSFGIVKTDQLLDYDGKRFHPDGLFSQKIFGCVTSWHCECGRYNPGPPSSPEERGQPGMPYKIVCERCHVLLTRNSERRKRCGHIDLAATILHPYFWGNSFRPVELLLGLSTRELRQLMAGKIYVFLTEDMWKKELNLAAVIPSLPTPPSRPALPRWESGFRVLIDLLEDIDLSTLSSRLEMEIDRAPSSLLRSHTWQKLTRRLELVRNLIDNTIDPFDFLLRTLPVLPAGLRKIRANHQGTIRVDELTRRYQDVLFLNNSIEIDTEDEELLVPFRKRMTRLVRRVFELLPGGFPYPLTNRVEIPPHFQRNPASNSSKILRLPRSRKLAAIEADAAYRYPGDFKLRVRKELPPRWKGKLVDYSAVSYLVPDPSLRPFQCGLPLDPIAWELFRPLVVGKIMKKFSFSQSIAEAFVTCRGEIALDCISEVMGFWPVVLNFPDADPSCRVKAFFPRYVADKSIHLHPVTMQQLGLKTTGATVKVLLPLSRKAAGEAVGMVSSPVTGPPSADHSHSFWPTSGALLGCYQATKIEKGHFGSDNSTTLAHTLRVFKDPVEVELAVEFGKLGWNTPIRYRLATGRILVEEDQNEQARGPVSKQIISTAGRVLFDELIRSVIPEVPEVPYFNVSIDHRAYGQVRAWFLKNNLRRQLQALVEKLSSWGMHQITQSALSLCSADFDIPSSKIKRIGEAWKEVEKTQRFYNRGIISPMERYNKVLDIWTNAREQITQEIDNLLSDQADQSALSAVISAPLNPELNRSSILRRIIGLSGPIAKPDGSLNEMPVTSSLREGLPSWEYFLLLPGQRRESLYKKERRADAWKMIRELAPVLRDLHVTSRNCKTAQSLEKRPIIESYNGGNLRSLSDSLPGRTSAETLIDPITDETIIAENQTISRDQAMWVEQSGIASFRIRSPLTCEEIQGVCSACLGEHPEDIGPRSPGQAIGSQALLALADQILEITPLRRFFISRPVQDPPGEVRALCGGQVSLNGLNVGTNSQGERIALARDGSLSIRDWQSRVLATAKVPHGAKLVVREDETVRAGALLASWHPLLPKVYAPAKATVKLVNLLPGNNVELGTHASGNSLWHVTRDLGPLRPQLILLDPMGMRIDHHFLLQNTWLNVRDGQSVDTGTLLAETILEPQKDSYQFLPGLPQIAIPLRAIAPRPRALLAECSGKVEVSTIDPQGHCQILVHELTSKGKPTGEVYSHPLSPFERPIVRSGEYVRQGDQLTAGEVSWHDLLRICGRAEASGQLLSQVLYALSMQRLTVDLDERIWEMVVSRLFSQVEILSPGSTQELPGKVTERNRLIQLNEQLRHSYVITETGDGPFERSYICLEVDFQAACKLAKAQRMQLPQGERPWLVGFHPLLTGVGDCKWYEIPPVHIAGRSSPKNKLIQAALRGYREAPESAQESMLTGRLISTGSGWSRRKS